MRVSVKKSGGIAGLKVRAEVDSEQLSPAQGRKMKDLVEQANLFDQPAKPSGRSMPDQFQYEVTVEDQGKTHSFVTNEAAASDDLLELVDWLIAASKRKGSGN
ncbi:MAG: protealysin inhibitor emfourin [Blastocatellales bacterium]